MRRHGVRHFRILLVLHRALPECYQHLLSNRSSSHQNELGTGKKIV
jgi:hypothetical protein